MAFEVQNPFENLTANPWDELTMEEDGGLFVESIVTTNTQSKDGKNKDKTVKTFGNGDKEITEYQHTTAADETISVMDDNKIPGFIAQGFPTTYSGGIETEDVFIPAAFDGTEKSAMEAYLGNKKYEAGRNFFQQALLSSIKAKPKYVYSDGREYTGAIQMINGQPADAAGQPLIKVPTEAEAKEAVTMQNNIGSRHPDEVKKGYWDKVSAFFDTDRLDRTNAEIEADNKIQAIRDGEGYPYRAGPNKEIDRYTDSPAVGSGNLVSRGQEEAEELFALENPQTWTPEVVEKVLSNSPASALTGDADRDKDRLPTTIAKEKRILAEKQILANSKAAQESLDILRQQLKTLKSKDNYKVNSQEAYLDFLRENNVLKDFRPDLYKALAGAAFGMLMGQDIDDAFYNSFGGMQAEKDLKAAEDLKFEREKEIENLKNAGKSGGGSFAKTPIEYNIGSYLNPKKVNGTVLENGMVRIMHPEKGLIDLPLGATDQYGELILKPWYTTQEIDEQVKSNIDRITTLLKGDMNKFIQGKDVGSSDQESIISSLLVSSEVEGAVYDAIERGVNLGPGSGSNTAILTNAANAAIRHKLNFPNSQKTFRDHMEDMMIRADMRGVNDMIPSTAYLNATTYKDKKGNEKNSKPITDKAYSETEIGTNDYIIKMKQANVEGMEDVITNQQKFQFTYERFLDWQKEFPEKVQSNYIVAHEQGYTPFMYWVKKESKNY